MQVSQLYFTFPRDFSTSREIRPIVGIQFQEVNPTFANSLSSFPLDIIPQNWSLGGSLLDLLFVECHLEGEADGRNWEALKSGWEDQFPFPRILPNPSSWTPSVAV